jgi:hypothetical protein
MFDGSDIPMPLAVVPVLMGPLQALMLVLPQVVLGVLLGFRSLPSLLV